MKKHPARPRTALLIGAALLATPALAQEAPTQTVTPPPIAVTPQTAPAPAPRVEMAPAAPIVQPAPPPGPRAEAVTEAAPRAERSATRATQTRQTVRQTARAAAPVREAAPAPAAEPAAPAAPVAQSTAPVAEAAAPIAAAPAPEAAAPLPATETTTTQTATSDGSSSSLPWLLGGLLLLLAGAAAFLLMRRRNDETDTVEEPVHERPIAPRAYEAPAAAAPVRAAPVIEPRRQPELSPFMAATAAATVAPAAIPSAADDIAEAHVEAELAEPASEDLAGVTDAPAPVANRPWLEFGLRPVRAGTSEDEALVDVELTVGNSGDVPARNVRISTFMLADAEGSDMEGLLTGRAADTAVPPVTIEPGDGTRVDAHLAVPKGEMGRVFNPVVVAEARYTLPDGREGRTSAMFKIGRPSAVSDGVGPIGATRPHMVDDVEAELVGTPRHA